ncbi:MAG: O-antigen ligase family protein [Planctomycetota bacterium]
MSFLFRVHSTSWIYAQGVGTQTITAALALASVFIGHRSQAKKECLRQPYVCAFAGFLTWCFVCAVVATLSDGGYEPPLQFHPCRLFQAAAISACILMLRDRTRTLTLIAQSLVITLLVRIALLDPVQYRDAGIASDVAMAVPLVGYLIVSSDKWWKRLAFLVVAFGFAWVIFRVENRGSAIGLTFGMIAIWVTSRHKALGILLGLPALGGSLFWFRSTSFGTLFFDAERWASDKRMTLFRESFEIGTDHPLFGVGPGNFVNRIGEYANELEHYSSHNFLLNVFAETGLPGLGLYGICFLLAVASGSRGVRREKCAAARWALVTLAVATGVGMFLTTTMFVLPYMMMAICVSAASDE